MSIKTVVLNVRFVLLKMWKCTELLNKMKIMCFFFKNDNDEIKNDTARKKAAVFFVR